jgi:hypothetical protein
MKNQAIIPEIFNYCDRWCERCPFLHRCQIGAMEIHRWSKGVNWETQELLNTLELVFPISDEHFAAWLEENDIHLSDIEPDGASDPDAMILALEKEMQERGAAYYKPLQDFLETNEDALLERGINLSNPAPEGIDTQERSAFAEAMDIILWYQYFMSIKASRAVNGLDTMHILIPGGNKYQNDANGSAKLVMLSTARSLGAWETLRQVWPEKQPEIQQFMQQLNDLRFRMQQLFPDWKRFIRPGFDTEVPQKPLFGEN